MTDAPGSDAQPPAACSVRDRRAEICAAIERAPDTEPTKRGGTVGSSGELDAAKDHRPPEFSDEALALRFAARHAADLRYVAALGKWLLWDGARWRFDDTLHAFDRARFICREAAAECDNG
jgi:hypothetical protein